jgi:signal transduction histidine kinase
MRAGDLSARTGLKYGSGEVGHLARAFDDMAGSLEVRIAESEHARAERERLLESEHIARTEAETAQERTAHILERITDGFVALDTRWCYTYVNQKAGELFQRSPEDLVGKHIWTEFPEGVGQPFYDAYYKAVADQASLHIEAYYAPWARWFENRIYPSTDGLTIYFHEITERRRAQEQLRESSDQLRALSAHLQSIREDERARIAREIHDELGQALTGLKMDVSWLDARFTKEGEVDKEGCLKKTSAMSRLIMSTIQSVRRIGTELRPGILDDLGIVAAVEWQAQDFEGRTGISCSFETAIEELEIGPERSTAIFRIAQETLTNVARHSGASRVSIVLKRQNGSLILEVSDNGRGIAAAEVSGARSLGLLGMRERAAGLGGHLQVEAAPDHGTVVIASIPLGRNS